MILTRPDVSESEDHWISAADLMGGALIIFFLLMLYFMMMERERSQQKSEIYNQTIESLETRLQGAEIKAQKMASELEGAYVQQDSVREVAVLYDQKRAEVYEALVAEFAGDLPRWNAEIYEDLTVRFNSPEVLFAVGSSTLRERFRRILNDFFPRYLELLMQEGFRDSISELRIEGHTSSFWNRSNPEPPQIAYLKNMDLSYERCRTVLRYVMALPELEDELPWLREHLTANGLSSSQLIFDENGNEDFRRSQRVEFRVRTDVESKMAKILDTAQ